MVALARLARPVSRAPALLARRTLASVPPLPPDPKTHAHPNTPPPQSPVGGTAQKKPDPNTPLYIAGVIAAVGGGYWWVTRKEYKDAKKDVIAATADQPGKGKPT